MKTRDTVIKQVKEAVIAVDNSKNITWKLKRLQQIANRYGSSHGAR